MQEHHGGPLSAAHGRILDISEHIEKNMKPGWCGIYNSPQAHYRLGNPTGHPMVASKADEEDRAYYTNQALANLVENNNEHSSLTTF